MLTTLQELYSHFAVVSFLQSRQHVRLGCVAENIHVEKLLQPICRVSRCRFRRGTFFRSTLYAARVLLALIVVKTNSRSLVNLKIIYLT